MTPPRVRRHLAPIPALLVLLPGLALAVSACADGAAPTEPDDASDSTALVPAAATTWLRREAHPFATAEPDGDLSDLAFLRDLVGDARVVSLGEGTHGTREFFRMKHRILRYLVEEMGFTAFAIEGSWPEANRIDDYVRTGLGDPASLLSGLYFWTWDTEAVLDMIAWMRDSNRSGTPVGFYGFDMQFPGMAITNVERFVDRVAPDATAEVGARLACLAKDANAPDGTSQSRYANETASYQDACRADVERVYDLLASRSAALAAAGGEQALATALRSARIVVQYEAMASGNGSRDAFMAENALWLLDRLGPGARIVLWAHNGHVKTSGQSMGQYLSDALGDDLVTLGFAFGSGSFNAVLATGSGYAGLQAHTVSDVPPLSYEDYFRSAGLPRFVLDLRGRSGAAPDEAWLQGPRLLRSVGAVFDPGRPFSFFYDVSLPHDFDAVVWFRSTQASRILPFDPPPTFYPSVVGAGGLSRAGG